MAAGSSRHVRLRAHHAVHHLLLLALLLELLAQFERPLGWREGARPKRARRTAVGEEAVKQAVAAAALALPGESMTAFQEAWCSDENVGACLRAAGGDATEAGRLLARALRWRERHREVLSGEREPSWQGDMRVLTRGKSGSPIVYLSMRHAPPPTATARELNEHNAAVLEAAVRAMSNGASTLDIIFDCHAFGLSGFNAAAAVSFLEMLSVPYRDRLHSLILVDAPSTLATTWWLLQGAMSEETRRRIRWLSSSQAVAELRATAGDAAAAAVGRAMEANRGPSRAPGPLRFPSEVEA